MRSTIIEAGSHELDEVHESAGMSTHEQNPFIT